VLFRSGNAVKFTRQGRIFLTVDLQNQTDRNVTLRFEVKDTGIGIADDHQGKLFQSFSQVDASTTRQFGGTGLGLAISKQLVEMMDGQIQVTSTPNQGSTFRFTVVLKKMDAATTDAGASTTTPSQSETLPQRKATAAMTSLNILLTEDNPMNLKVTEKLLSLMGHQVTIAVNGQEAVKQFARQETNFDLIFMDIQMPIMDGITATREIRAMAEEADRPVPPIVALTAHAMTGDRERLLDSGLDDYVAKPLTRTALTEVITRVVQNFNLF
jgi:CheY-like chemotaxis protein